MFAEDELKTGGGGVGGVGNVVGGGNNIKSPTNGRARNGSTTEMAVDQLQASEKLIAGKFLYSGPLCRILVHIVIVV